ncbi:MAG: hypothetical protein RMJ51_04915 [Candidatus Calescibacterium sp.]|nr:hypothetical protein [Candidatus Calescibacterium sp.]MCX7972547.1 hypothetical protein [bacterium]MDW8195560.1 hypothetical protein [Candidatus Calescibacterium sp.]
MENIEKEIEKINETILKGVENKDLLVLRKGITELKNILKIIYDDINEWKENIDSSEEVPIIFEIIPNLQKVNDILQDLLAYLEKEKLDEKDLEEIRQLENETEQIIEIIETLTELPEEDEDETEIDLEEEIEKIMQEDEEIEEEFDEDLDDTGNQYINSILETIKVAIDNQDHEKIEDEIQKLMNYISSDIDDKNHEEK